MKKIRSKLILTVAMISIIFFTGIKCNEVNAQTLTCIDENGIVWEYDEPSSSVDLIFNLSYVSGELPEELVIPTTINGRKVSTLKEDMFANADKTKIKSIVLPNTISEITDGSFTGCFELKNINITSNISYIGEYAFYGCKKLENINVPNNTLSYIGKYAFRGCERLKEVIIGSSSNENNQVLKILENAFSNCYNLTNFTTYQTVIFENNVFEQSNSLKKVSLFGGTLGIGDYCFQNNMLLRSIEIEEVQQEIRQDATIGYMAFSNCISLSKIVLPSNIVKLGGRTFFNCYNLEKIEIQKDLSADWALDFAGTKFAIASNPDELSDKDFTSIILAEGVTGIPDLKGIKNLKTLYIPSTVSHISYYELRGCENLENVIISEDNPNFVVEDSIIYSKDMSTLIRCLPGKSNEVKIPDQVKIINDYAFIGCSKLKGKLVIPKNVTDLNYAFYRCMSEIPIVLEEGITRIDSYAFAESKFIGDIVIPDSVTYIGSRAFFNCTNFDGILKLPNFSQKSYSEIPADTFYNCSGLKGDLIIPEKVKNIGESAFKGCSGLDGKLIIEASERMNIGRHAFMDCTGIKEIVVMNEDADVHVGYGTFYNCTSLTNTGKVIASGYYTYTGCKNIKIWDVSYTYGFGYCGFYGLELIEEVKIPEGVYVIEDFMFGRCRNLKTVYIPSTVQEIYNNAFYGCNNIQDIYVANTRDAVNYVEYLESICANVHYLESESVEETEAIVENSREQNKTESTKENIETVES